MQHEKLRWGQLFSMPVSPLGSPSGLMFLRRRSRGPNHSERRHAPPLPARLENPGSIDVPDPALRGAARKAALGTTLLDAVSPLGPPGGLMSFPCGSRRPARHSPPKEFRVSWFEGAASTAPSDAAGSCAGDNSSRCHQPAGSARRADDFLEPTFSAFARDSCAAPSVAARWAALGIHSSRSVSSVGSPTELASFP